MIHDIWGGTSGKNLAPGYHVSFHEYFGPHLEGLIFEPR